MSPEDVGIFGPRPKLSQSMSNAEDLQGRGDHHVYINNGYYPNHCTSKVEAQMVTAVVKRTNSTTSRMTILSGECNLQCVSSMLLGWSSKKRSSNCSQSHQ